MEGKKVLVYDKEQLSGLKEQYYTALGAAVDSGRAGTALYLTEEALIRFAINMMPDDETIEIIQFLAATSREQVIQLILRLET